MISSHDVMSELHWQRMRRFATCVRWRAVNLAIVAVAVSATFAIAAPDAPPVVTAPTTQTVVEGTALTFTVTASDTNGDAITSLTAAPLPSGATFTPNGSNTSGSFSWTPGCTQAGTYQVVFTASNALTGRDTTTITVTNADCAPVVTAPATRTVAEGGLLTFTVSASDPDGNPITSLTAAPLPSGATFTPNGSNTSGSFSWTPGYSDSGTYNIVFTAANALTSRDTTIATVTNVDRAPVVTAPATYHSWEGGRVDFTVTVSDPDGDAIASLAASPLPGGAAFTPNAPRTSAFFSWQPSYTQAGSYQVVLTASNALSGRDTTVITVDNTDRPPVVTALNDFQ